jgi:hypothetical protein
MKSSCVELNDLPDEILIIILKRLSNVDVLYSFQDVNERLNRIISDPIFTSYINFLQWSNNKFANRFSSNVILNRFCLQILPKISMKIKWFELETSCMKSILCAADYSNLYGLGLYNIEERTIRSLLRGKSTLNKIVFFYLYI